MNSRYLSTLWIAGFLLLGAVSWALRYHSIRRDETAREDTHWELTYAAHFEAVVSTGQEESQVKLGIPFDTRYCQVVPGRESWIVTNPNLHAKTTRPDTATGNRLLIFATRQAGTVPFDATAKFVLRVSPRADGGRQPVLEKLSSRDRFLRPCACYGARPLEHMKRRKSNRMRPDMGSRKLPDMWWIPA